MPPPTPTSPLPPYTPAPRQRPAAAALTLDDLTADLVWPALLRAGALALRPARLGLGAVQAVGLLLLVMLFQWMVRASTADTTGALARHLAADVDAGAAGGGGRWLRAVHWGGVLFDAAVTAPALALRDHPLAVLVVLPLALLWTAVLGGAIARSAACDHAQGVALSWPQALGFALTRWKSLTLSLSLPLLLAWIIALALAVGGWALFSLGGVNVLGGLLWGLFILGGLIIAVVLTAFFVAWPLLVPSVACEATDAVDAFQHAYSFAFARPLRLVLYTLLLVVQGAVLVGLIGGLVWMAVHAAQTAATAWSGPRGEAVLGVLPDHSLLTSRTGAPATTPPPMGGPSRAAHALASFWTNAALALPMGVLMSYLWSASTLLYLAMRRLVDGQDQSEIWMPGLAEGVLAPLPPISPPKPSDTITDTGPADET